MYSTYLQLFTVKLPDMILFVKVEVITTPLLFLLCIQVNIYRKLTYHTGGTHFKRII